MRMSSTRRVLKEMLAGTRYSIKPGIGDADLFIIDGEDGEVRFKPGSIPATFDIDGEFNFIIIERSGGDVTETVVTLYNNARHYRSK